MISSPRMRRPAPLAAGQWLPEHTFADGGSEDVPGNRRWRDGPGECQGHAKPSSSSLMTTQTIRSLLHEALNLRGYQVTAVGTVQEAEDTLQQRGAAALGLVITDIQLTANQQAREGYVLYCKCWKASYPALPFLLISGDLSNQTLPAIRTGAVHFLPKPFTMSELLDTVHRLFLPVTPTKKLKKKKKKGHHPGKDKKGEVNDLKKKKCEQSTGPAHHFVSPLPLHDGHDVPDLTPAHGIEAIAAVEGGEVKLAGSAAYHDLIETRALLRGSAGRQARRHRPAP